MTVFERVAVAVMVGLSGAAVMAAINWGYNSGSDGRLMLGSAFLGAALAGAALAGKFGRRPLVATLASLTATILGAALGAFFFFLRPDAILMGPIFLIGALMDVPPLLGLWAVTQLGAHLGTQILRRRFVPARL